MTAAHLIRVCVIFAIQFAFLLALLLPNESSSKLFSRMVSLICIPAAFIVPFAGHIYALYTIKLLDQLPPAAKVAILAIVSIFLTFLGFIMGFFILMILGFPIFPNH